MKYMMFGVEKDDKVEKFYGISSNNSVIEETCKPISITLPAHLLNGLTFDGYKGDKRKDRFSYSVYIPMAKIPKYMVFGISKGKAVAFYGFTTKAEGTESKQSLEPFYLQGRVASGRLGPKGRYNPVTKKYDAQPFYLEVK